MMKQNLSGYLAKTIGAPPTDLNDDGADIDELRAAYQAVVKGEDLSPIGLLGFRQGGQSLFDDIPETRLPSEAKPLLTGVLKNPRMLAAMFCGLCVLGSAIYAGLGLWWVMDSEPAQSAEPVAMLNVSEARDLHRQTRQVLNNLDETELLAQAQPTVAVAGMTDELVPLKEITPEATGRFDPFEPLVRSGSGLDFPGMGDAKEKDVLSFLNYAGFIGDIASKDKVAIIKINDSMGSKTLIKKIGESFMVEGQKVILKGIAKNTLQLNVAGVSRRLSLSAYQAVASSGSSSVSAGGGSAAAASGLSNLAKVEADAKKSTESSKSADVKLEEPE